MAGGPGGRHAPDVGRLFVELLLKSFVLLAQIVHHLVGGGSAGPLRRRFRRLACRLAGFRRFCLLCFRFDLRLRFAGLLAEPEFLVGIDEAGRLPGVRIGLRRLDLTRVGLAGVGRSLRRLRGDCSESCKPFRISVYHLINFIINGFRDRSAIFFIEQLHPWKRKRKHLHINTSFVHFLYSKFSKVRYPVWLIRVHKLKFIG